MFKSAHTDRNLNMALQNPIYRQQIYFRHAYFRQLFRFIIMFSRKNSNNIFLKHYKLRIELFYLDSKYNDSILR